LLLGTAQQVSIAGAGLRWYSAAMTGPVVADARPRALAAARCGLARDPDATTATLILLTTAIDSKSLGACQTQPEWNPPNADRIAGWERVLAANPGSLGSTNPFPRPAHHRESERPLGLI